MLLSTVKSWILQFVSCVHVWCGIIHGTYKTFFVHTSDSPESFDDVAAEFEQRNLTKPIYIIWTDFERVDFMKFRWNFPRKCILNISLQIKINWTTFKWIKNLFVRSISFLQYCSFTRWWIYKKLSDSERYSRWWTMQKSGSIKCEFLGVIAYKNDRLPMDAA